MKNVMIITIIILLLVTLTVACKSPSNCLLVPYSSSTQYNFRHIGIAPYKSSENPLFNYVVYTLNTPEEIEGFKVKGEIPKKIVVDFEYSHLLFNRKSGDMNTLNSMRKNSTKSVICDTPLEAQSPQFWRNNPDMKLYINFRSPDDIIVFTGVKPMFESNPDSHDEVEQSLIRYQEIINSDAMIFKVISQQGDDLRKDAMMGGDEAFTNDFYTSSIYPTIKVKEEQKFAIISENYYNAFVDTDADRLGWVGNLETKSELESILSQAQDIELASKKMLISGYLKRESPHEIINFYNNFDKEMQSYFSFPVSFEQFFAVYQYNFIEWGEFARQRKDYSFSILYECNAKLFARMENFEVMLRGGDCSNLDSDVEEILSLIESDSDAMFIWLKCFQNSRWLRHIEILQMLLELQPKISMTPPNTVTILEDILNSISYMPKADIEIGYTLLNLVKKMPIMVPPVDNREPVRVPLSQDEIFGGFIRDIQALF